jgi:hypothetical protein
VWFASALHRYSSEHNATTTDSVTNKESARVLTNEELNLSTNQLRRYNEWAAGVARAHGEADAAESLEISIRFTFRPIFGRTVEARVGHSTHVLVIED